MEIIRRKAGDVLEIKLNGRLDATWSDLVSGALAESMRAGEHRLALDMEQVSYLSSAGIRVLMQAYKQLRAIDGRLCIVRPSIPVRSTLELSGLGMLFADRSPDPRSAPEPSAAAEPAPQPQAAAPAPVAAELIGGRAAGLAELGAQEGYILRVDQAALAVGLGALGEARDGEARFGELLAAGGAACVLPAEASAESDYLVRQGDFIPSARLFRGIAARGRLSAQFWFGEEGGSPISAVARAALGGSAAAAFAVIAETAWLVGAALKSAAAPEGDPFSFPAIKDTLSFAGEPVHGGAVSLIVGFVAARADALPDLVRPLVPQGDLFGHLHAAVFPYAPLRKGEAELEAAVRALFETRAPAAVLHLINDWRDCVGSGESRLVRGACWHAPLAVNGLG